MLTSTKGRFAPTSEPLESRSNLNDPRLTREQVLSQIVELNPGASADFLARFRDEALQEYLQRLNLRRDFARGPSPWIRHTSAPAIVFRDPAE